MIFASNNKNKIKQIKELFNNTALEIKSLKECNIDIDVEEDGKTAEENAIKKATEIFKLTNDCVLADDSGLSIDYFDGWPGVYTHRFIPNSTSQERNDAIIEKMQNVSEELRGASTYCVLAFCDKKGNITTFKGEVRCKIGHQQKGDNLFGFDPIVVLSNNKTLAELTDEEKVKVNARSLAFKKFLDFYKQNEKLFM